MSSDWETVIGLEVHAQLLTRTKCFCACSTSFGDPPNTNICPVCLALPGALPVLNREAVRMAVLAALALHCTVSNTSVFARKNYFYPDLPKGYQISQFDRPLATNGYLDVESFDPKGKPLIQRRARIDRLHIEEDAGKNLHGFGGYSVVDLNRAGTPLIEIVGAPDLRSSEEVAEYLKQIRNLLMFLGVCDGNLEQGSLRCDINVSVRPAGATTFGTRTEIKNVNSFRFAQHAIDYEVSRQLAVLSAGGHIVQETRGWDEKAGRTFSQRSKEEAHDYRYFPEPDLPPLCLQETWIEELRGQLGDLPKRLRERFQALGLTSYAAGVLTSHPQIAGFFSETISQYPDAARAANFILSELMRDCVVDGLHARFSISPRQLSELLRLVDAGTISGKQSKDVYAAISNTDTSPEVVVRERGMAQLSDSSQIEAVCLRLIEGNPQQVADFRAGKTNVMAWFVGQVMKQTRGSANPAVVNQILSNLLKKEP